LDGLLLALLLDAVVASVSTPFDTALPAMGGFVIASDANADDVDVAVVFSISFA
jgi:hypothetical protein